MNVCNAMFSVDCVQARCWVISNSTSCGCYYFDWRIGGNTYVNTIYWQLSQQLIVNHLCGAKTSWNNQWQGNILTTKNKGCGQQCLFRCLMVDKTNLQVLFLCLQRCDVHLIPFGRESILLYARVPVNRLAVSNSLLNVLWELIHLCGQSNLLIRLQRKIHLIHRNKLTELSYRQIHTIIALSSDVVGYCALSSR